MVTVDSLEQAFDALPALEGAAQDATRGACALLEDGAPTRGPPNADQAVREAPTSETTIGLLMQARRSNFTIPDARRARLPDRLIWGSYVKPMEWGRPSEDMSASGLDEARLIIDHWNPFDKRDSSIAHIRKLYPNLLRIPMVASAKESTT